MILVSVRKEFDSLESFVILLWPPIRFSGDGRCGRVRTVASTNARVLAKRACEPNPSASSANCLPQLERDCRRNQKPRTAQSSCTRPVRKPRQFSALEIFDHTRSPCAASMADKRWTRRRSSSRLTSPHDRVTIGIGSYAENEFPPTIGHDLTFQPFSLCDNADR